MGYREKCDIFSIGSIFFKLWVYWLCRGGRFARALRGAVTIVSAQEVFTLISRSGEGKFIVTLYHSERSRALEAIVYISGLETARQIHARFAIYIECERKLILGEIMTRNLAEAVHT
jgi:D-arabinose 5-phosphate isomerase GutQ